MPAFFVLPIHAMVSFTGKAFNRKERKETPQRSRRKSQTENAKEKRLTNRSNFLAIFRFKPLFFASFAIFAVKGFWLSPAIFAVKSF